MRIAVLIIGLLLGAVMFFQSLLAAGLAGAADDDEVGAAASVGLLMALLWLIGCALVIGFPRTSAALFLVAGLLGFAASGAFPDLAYWGGASLVLAVLSFLGWRGKRRDTVRREAERQADIERAVAAGVAAATAGRATDGTHQAAP